MPDLYQRPAGHVWTCPQCRAQTAISDASNHKCSKPTPDLHAAIRDLIASDMTHVSGAANDIGEALLAVLDLHPADRDHMCIKDIVGYAVQAWYDDEPCPTTLAIAEKLGIET